jgi:uncharacterized protein (UPF0248 family)
LLLAVTAVLSGCGERPGWEYRGEFHQAIAQADRIIVRDGGFQEVAGPRGDRVVFELTAAAEIKEVLEKLQFEKRQEISVCPCSGFPRLEWYQGKKRVAVTSIQHGRAVRWKGFLGDAQLTEQSAAWLVSWLSGHGVDENKMK